MQQILPGLIGFLHNLFTVLWVGGLVMVVISLLPAIKQAGFDEQQTRVLMNALMRRHRIWVYISIVGLFVTGIMQARLSPSFNGLMKFDTFYGALTSLKHILTFLMIIIAVYRSVVMAKKLEAAKPKMLARSFMLIKVNAGLGVMVLLLSSLM